MSSISEITDRQAKVLAFCIGRWDAGESLPSLREICTHFGYASTRAAADHLKVLKTKGYLADATENTRGYRLTKKATGLPVLGRVPAGTPTATSESQESRIPGIAEYFGVRNRSNAFFLRVYGDSMIGRQIFDGDLVLIEKTNRYKHNDVVAALIDNESTLKTLIMKRGRSWLRSENPQYQDLTPAVDLRIQGVARGVLRLFRS
jgi:repressor LexA